MKIVDKLKAFAQRQSPEPCFSFEFFPPRDEAGMELLFETVAHLRRYEPAYVSVTYGAGGSTRRLTVDLVTRIKRETGIETMAHLNSVGSTKDEIKGVLDQLAGSGIENVLPLRGDPPKGEARFVKTEGGFGYASELVEFIRTGGYDFCLAGACYPETHPEAPNAHADLRNLGVKVRAGVDVLITQLFFDNEDYFRFVDRARADGIDPPVIPGIMPVTNLAQVKRFTAMCGAKIPKELLARLEATGGDVAKVRAIGVEHAVGQCRELLERGAPGIHFYTLNRSRATVEILEAIR